MALTFPPGFYLAKLRWRLEGDADEMVSTLGLRNNEPGDRDLTEVAEAVYWAWDGAMQPLNLCIAYSFVGVDVAEGSDTGATNVGSYDHIIQGSGNWAALPTNCALLIKKKTALAGRQNSGRMFLPAGYLGESNVTNTGALLNATTADFQNKMTQFYDNLRDQTQPAGHPITSFWPVLIHGPRRLPQAQQPTQGPTQYEPGGAPTDITGFAVDGTIATQRERMRR